MPRAGNLKFPPNLRKMVMMAYTNSIRRTHVEVSANEKHQMEGYAKSSRIKEPLSHKSSRRTQIQSISPPIVLLRSSFPLPIHQTINFNKCLFWTPLRISFTLPRKIKWHPKQLPLQLKLKSSSLDADVLSVEWDGIMRYKCWVMKFPMLSFAM